MTIKIDSKDELTMYRNYVHFLHPIIDVSPQERDVLAMLMMKYNELALDVKSDDLINKLLFTSETRNFISDKLEMSKIRYDGILTKLRKQKIVRGRSIPKQIIPEIEKGVMKVTVLIRQDEGKSTRGNNSGSSEGAKSTKERSTESDKSSV